ncbi:MAG TPA: LLM class F420-dependent oxidoreductase [Pirellulales bacterium]|nr:LLM class F420-dependent oxidoreductase [Pirellulales bacterium]
MRIGIQTFFDGKQSEPLPVYVKGVGQALEERGFEAVWMSEHVVTFPKYDPAFPYPYSDDGVAPAMLSEIGILDPMTALAALAMTTSTLRLGTGVALLPQRNPVYFAKMGAAVDLLSNGRFIAGVGLGWSGQEYAALDVPFEHRGARMREYIQIVLSLWCDELSKFEGKYYALPECIHLPKPARKPYPPLYFGGESAAALRRVAEFGQGWVGFRLTPEEVETCLVALKDMLSKYGRSLADIDIVVSPGVERECDAGMLEAYAKLGVAEVVVICMSDSLDGFCRQADDLAKKLIGPARQLTPK